MVVRKSVLEAYEAFTRALRRFVGEDEHEYIEVFESPPGALWANIGTEKFHDVSSTERQNIIWEFLQEELPSEVLSYCWGVHCMDVSEYRDGLLRRSSGETDLYIRGSDVDVADD